MELWCSSDVGPELVEDAKGGEVVERNEGVISSRDGQDMIVRMASFCDIYTAFIRARCIASGLLTACLQCRG